MESNGSQEALDLERYREAKALFRAGKPREALPLLQGLLTQYPKNATVQNAVDLCWSAIEERESAIHTKATSGQSGFFRLTRSRVFVLTSAACVVIFATIAYIGIEFSAREAPRPERFQNESRYALTATPPISAQIDTVSSSVLPGATEIELESTEPVQAGSALSNPEWTVQILATGSGIRTMQTPYGDYLDYVPPTARFGSYLVVLVHGSPEKNKDIRNLARWYIGRKVWRDLADQTGWILVAPCFDLENFGGYRRLKGKQIGADEFLLRIADDYVQRYTPDDQRFALYGHSAGGQFVARFAVTHPTRLHAVCISAPGNYAWPDETIEWPYGLATSPNPKGFLLANSIPMAVIVGELDTNSDPKALGGGHQSGATRIERGANWIMAMRDYAQRQGQTSLAEFYLIPQVGHSSAGLTPACAAWLAR